MFSEGTDLVYDRFFFPFLSVVPNAPGSEADTEFPHLAHHVHYLVADIIRHR